MKRMKRLFIGILVSSMMILQLCNIVMAEEMNGKNTQKVIKGGKNISTDSSGISGTSLSIKVSANSKGEKKGNYTADEYSNTQKEIKYIFSKELIVEPNSYVDVKIKGANLSIQDYKIVKDTEPALPTEDNGWTDLGTLNESELNTEESYSDIILEKQGYISTKHYDYSGNHSTREVTFGRPTGKNLVIQKATGVGNKKYYAEEEGYAFFQDSLLAQDGGANKAVKFWGYIKPQGIKKGEFNLGSKSDDGAYGYIIIGEKKVEFVNDWTIMAAYNRSNNNNIELEPGKVYPIYMEWYEGQVTNKAFLPSYKEAGSSNWKEIPQDWFYPSSNTEPGDINTAYFNPVTASRIPLGDTPGTYYVVVQVKDKANQAYQLAYGPFLIEGAKLNTVGDKKRNYIVPCSISNIYWDIAFTDDYKGLTYEIDLSDVISKSVVGFDYDKMVVRGTPDAKDYTVSVDKVNNKITIKFVKESTGADVLLSDIASDEAGTYKMKMGIYLPTTLNSDVKYYGENGYIEDYLSKIVPAKLKIKGKKKYITQKVLPNGKIIEEVKYEPEQTIKVQIKEDATGKIIKETDKPEINLTFSEISDIY